MQRSPNFFFFSLLLATGICLKCERCISSSTKCSGIPYPCAINLDSCIIITIEHIVADNDKWIMTFKGCTKKDYCPSPSSTFSFPSQRKRRAVKCCHYDLCNKGEVALPKLSLIPNGLMCPGCFSAQTECKRTETLHCHGPERKCLSYYLTVEQGDQAYSYTKWGCATKSGCSKGSHMYGVPGVFLEVLKSSNCKAASTTPNPN